MWSIIEEGVFVVACWQHRHDCIVPLQFFTRKRRSTTDRFGNEMISLLCITKIFLLWKTLAFFIMVVLWAHMAISFMVYVSLCLQAADIWMAEWDWTHLHDRVHRDVWVIHSLQSVSPPTDKGVNMSCLLCCVLKLIKPIRTDLLDKSSN